MVKLPAIGEVKLKDVSKIFLALILFLYIVLPFDLIPDALFGVGFIDDIIAGLILWQQLRETGILK